MESLETRKFHVHEVSFRRMLGIITENRGGRRV